MNERDSATPPEVMNAKCRSIYWNLLAIENEVPAPQLLRMWEETKRCDHVHDFSQVRADYERRVTPEAMKRIRKFESNDIDNARALDAILHYDYWGRRALISTFSLPDRLYYNTFVRAEQAIKSLGIIALFAGERKTASQSATNAYRKSMQAKGRAV